MFIYFRKVHVYETDMMGISHHSNYLRFCEEARVEWFFANGFTDASKEAVFGLTVYETRVQHVRPTRYRDELKIQVQVRAKAARLFFQYLVTVNDVVVARVETTHCSLDQDFKVQRLDQKLLKVLERETWTETWL